MNNLAFSSVKQDLAVLLKGLVPVPIRLDTIYFALGLKLSFSLYSNGPGDNF